MDLAQILIQVVSGAIGGNAAGAVSKENSLGPLLNTILGAIGGGVGGKLLASIFGVGATAATSGLDIGTIISAFATGGVSGGLTALVLGFVKSKMAA
jgi:uncharacterized membrane protein YeaQ/YmgE (transglycosylase-associated protein family)